MALQNFCSRAKSIINKLPTNFSTLIYRLLLYHAEHNYGRWQSHNWQTEREDQKAHAKKGLHERRSPGDRAMQGNMSRKVDKKLRRHRTEYPPLAPLMEIRNR
jgi:hypothetical protein